MATELKYALSLGSPPGYIQVFTDANNFWSTVAGGDLVAADEKYVLEVDSGFEGGTINWTSTYDSRSHTWNTSLATDNVVEIRPMPSSKFDYLTKTGATINPGSTGNGMLLIANPPNQFDVVFKDVGIMGLNTNRGLIWDWSGGNGTNCVLDRIYVESLQFILGGAFNRVSNSIFKMLSPSTQVLGDLNRTIGEVIFHANLLIVENGVSGSFCLRSAGDCVNNTYVDEGTGSYTLGFEGSSGSNNASTDGSAPGPGSFTNITPANEFVSPGSDYHLIETSQLRNAGANLFGNGYDSDNDDVARPNAPWDIGPFQFVTAAQPPKQNAIFHGHDF